LLVLVLLYPYVGWTNTLVTGPSAALVGTAMEVESVVSGMPTGVLTVGNVSLALALELGDGYGNTVPVRVPGAVEVRGPSALEVGAALVVTFSGTELIGINVGVSMTLIVGLGAAVVV